MSNGSRLVAVIVVVVLAAIGLYFAFLYNPDKVPAPVTVPVNTNLPQGTITAPAPGGPLDETKSGPAGGDAMKPITAPPSGAFAPPTGAAATGVASQNSPASGAGQSGATPGAGSATTPTASGANRPSNSAGGPTPVGVTPPASSSSERAPAPTPSIEYTVRAGDTLEGLSRRFLDDGSKWQSIVAANPGLSPTSLKIGQKIAIPTSKSASAAPSSGGSASANSAPANSAGSAAANTYTVLKGDTLMGIARKVYGSDADWRKILEANATQLRGDATAIQPGMKLSIPAKR
jgi:peptidoglycan endopeptidase LytF